MEAPERPSFNDLPAEILEAIFLHLDPHSLLSLSQTSKPIKALTTDSPVIWRHLCQTRFTSWDARHNIAAKYSTPLSQVDWRALFISRVQADVRIRDLLNTVIATQHQRMRRINEIAEYGYDAKDLLLKECACPDDAEDVLARRYYANAALERIHREFAINVWKELREGAPVPVERALGAYDVFVRADADVDTDRITADIDQLAQGVLLQCPDFATLNSKAKASTLAAYLRDQNYKGVSATSYRALRNSFIGLVLRSPTHESLPLVSVAIYCAVAQRLGLDARPCGFLFHVYTLVYAPKNYTLHGKYKPTSSSELDYMYLDPFRSTEEVHQGDLRRVLYETGVPSTEHATFLSDTTTREMVLRAARNIMNSVQTIRQEEADAHGIQPTWLTTHPDMDKAFYATIWAMLLLESTDEPSTGSTTPNSTLRLRQYIPYLLEYFQTHFPWDVHLLSRYIIPMFRHQSEGQRLVQFAQSMYHVDAVRKSMVPRTQHTHSVLYKIGQPFRHKRYSYEGVITGWDVACGADERWIAEMEVDGLPKGRHQAFYHVLVRDRSVRYVAEENIDTSSLPAQPSDAMMRLAGRHFKRWDAERGVFVSNMRDEYPDD